MKRNQNVVLCLISAENEKNEAKYLLEKGNHSFFKKTNISVISTCLGD